VTLTTVFAVYALALLTTLLFTGSLSDVIGRRPVIFGALGLELVSVTFFLIAMAWRGCMPAA
jgi:MFS family permease